MALPNFLIIGTAKAGTTALYHYLQQHPDIFMSPVKEANFFAYEGEDAPYHWLGPASRPQFPVTTLPEYEQLFTGGEDAVARGEASPLYLESPSVPARIHQQLPRVRLVTSLRNPADRAFSGYLMHVRMGRAPGDIATAFPDSAHYVRVGFYFEKLQRFYEHFPREQMEILIFEEWRRNPSRALQDLYRFLGVDDTFVANASVRHNVGSYPRFRLLNTLLSRAAIRDRLEPITPGWLKDLARRLRERNLGRTPEFPPEQRARLIRLYRDDILKLQDLIGKDLSSWLAV